MRTIADFKNTVPQVGRLEWIGVSSGNRQPIKTVETASIEVGTGLAGDHHAKRGASDRQVTLIQHEHVPVIAALAGIAKADPALFRRNLAVSGVNLLAFKDKRFSVGAEVVLQGTGPCEPCSRMEENIGTGGYNAMRGHGGITAIVLQAGTIRIGDEVRLIPPQASDEVS